MSQNQRSNSPRRGGVLFKDNSKYQLQTSKFAEAQRGILKSASLEDSLRSCKRMSLLSEGRQRPSLNLESLRKVVTTKSPRYGVSHGTGTDMLANNTHDLEAKFHDSNSSSSMSSTEPESEYFGDQVRHRCVQFSGISICLYPIAPSDHPGSSKGLAIALSGWRYTIPQKTPIKLDDYEATRPPRRTMENLKLDMMERLRRLIEHGASQTEMRDFAKRARKAKIERAETVKALTMYGKHHEANMELREKVGRFLQRAFGCAKPIPKRKRPCGTKRKKRRPSKPEKKNPVFFLVLQPASNFLISSIK